MYRKRSCRRDYELHVSYYSDAFWAYGLQIDRILRREGAIESRKTEPDEILDGDSFAKTLETLLLPGEFGPNSGCARSGGR